MNSRVELERGAAWVRGPPAGLRHDAVSVLQGGAPRAERMCVLHRCALCCAGRRPKHETHPS